MDELKKLHNVVLVKHQLSGNGPYLFAVPDGRNLKREQTVIVDTRKGIATDGVCVTDSFITDDTSLNAMVLLSGAKLPLRRVLGEHQVIIWEEEKNEPEVAENQSE
jgi:hypothetical protein